MEAAEDAVFCIEIQEFWSEYVDESATQQGIPVWRRMWVRVVLIVCLVLVAAFGIAAEYVARNAGPILRRSLVETLEQRLHEPVALDRLEISVMRGLEVRAFGLKVMPAPGTAAPQTPVIAAREIAFHTSLWSLLRLREHIDTAHVEGLELHIPPHTMGKAIHGRTGGASPHPAVTLTVDRIECEDAVLVIDTDKPGKLPLQFVIHHLTLTDVGGPQPLQYQADLINPKPTGALHVTGNFGPWHGDEPRATPITGQYVLRDADLSTIKGVRGTLQSAGTFGGVLESIVVDGSTKTPNFGLDVGKDVNALPLETQFHAIVDGTSGDTTLAPVQALLGHSAFTAQGTIQRIRQGGEDGGPSISLGHDIALDVTMPHGRIEDLLLLGMNAPKPMMRGTVTMKAKVHIPPGPVRVLQKLQLAGDVRIVGVEFTNPTVQDKLDGLSMRAQGRPQEAKDASHDQMAEVASDMDVQFALGDSLLKVASLQYNLPGAKVHLVGVYGLGSEAYRFEGQVRTEAKASEMVTGWKSMLLRPFNGLLAKNGAGVQLPISITGVKSDFKFGLHDSKESPDQMAAEMREGRQ